jgi:hypothetical protein
VLAARLADAAPKGHQMHDASEIFLSPAMLRTAIRVQLRKGTSREAISALIRTYAPEGASTERRNGEVHRLPVELIAFDRRLLFLDALNKLPTSREKCRPSRHPRAGLST